MVFQVSFQKVGAKVGRICLSDPIGRLAKPPYCLCPRILKRYLLARGDVRPKFRVSDHLVRQRVSTSELDTHPLQECRVRVGLLVSSQSGVYVHDHLINRFFHRCTQHNIFEARAYDCTVLTEAWSRRARLAPLEHRVI